MAFQVGFTPREGLVLHLLRYEDQGMLRPIIYRASLAEMFIPYGDPNPAHYRKNVFDMGEYGIGVLANRLELGGGSPTPISRTVWVIREHCHHEKCG